MGKRLLKMNILQPLTGKRKLLSRCDCCGELNPVLIFATQTFKHSLLGKKRWPSVFATRYAILPSICQVVEYGLTTYSQSSRVP